MRRITLKSQVLAVFAESPEAQFTALQLAKRFGKAEVYFSALLGQLFLSGLLNRHDIATNAHKRYAYQFKSPQKEDHDGLV